MKLLVVEDSDPLRKYLVKGLVQAGYAVDDSPDGEDGLWKAQSFDYDVIVLDLMLPRLSGLELLRSLRDAETESHILILTAKDTVQDRIIGLEQGADDYLIKPFDLGELLARIQSLLRRKYHVTNSVIHVDDLKIDLKKREVHCGTTVLQLRRREYALLEYLAVRAGEWVSKSEIETHIYDELVEPMSNVVESAICSLRREIDDDKGPSHIRTRRGVGYMLGQPTE